MMLSSPKKLCYMLCGFGACLVGVSLTSWFEEYWSKVKDVPENGEEYR